MIMEPILFDEIVPGGWNFSHRLKKGTSLRICDLTGGANVSALFYNARDPLERYNMADTLKAQFTARLTAGHVLYSDMGRILVSITEDTCGWHDPIGGISHAETIAGKHGLAPYQTHRNTYFRNGRDSLLVELAKYGLGKRDLGPNVNFFSKVVVNEAGQMRFQAGHSREGAQVSLRAEMDCLVILNTCPHPLDPEKKYAPKPVRMTVLKTTDPDAADPCFSSCEQNARGWINTSRYSS